VIVSGTPRLRPGEDPYRILGVAPDATDPDVTRAYRRLLRQHHPDTAPGHTGADHHRLQQVLAAYKQLRRLDQIDELPVRPSSSTAVPVAVHHHPATQTPSSAGVPRSRDRMRLDDQQHVDSRPSGRRRIPIARRGRDTTAAVTITADQAATGAVVTVAALDDPADGRPLRNIRVRIPPATRDGQTLRIPGRGGLGHAGGPAGDLHLTVYHAPADPL
jgi:curved DNA-binding protein